MARYYNDFNDIRGSDELIHYGVQGMLSPSLPVAPLHFLCFFQIRQFNSPKLFNCKSIQY